MSPLSSPLYDSGGSNYVCKKIRYVPQTAISQTRISQAQGLRQRFHPRQTGEQTSHRTPQRNHGGNTSAASSELSKRGYGKPCEMTWLAGEGGTISTVHPSPVIVGAANLLDPSTLTDIGLGRRLVAESGGRLRYAHDTGRWYWYDGRRWVARGKRHRP